MRAGTILKAPRSRTGRCWRVTGRTLGDRVLLLPVGFYAAGGGGVRGIWRTAQELTAWEIVVKGEAA